MAKQFIWNRTNIVSDSDIDDMSFTYSNVNPSYGAFDTETTGLHIILDTPFIFQCGFLDTNKMEGHSYAVDIEQNPEIANKFISLFLNKYAPKLEIFAAHNTTFDLSMLKNIRYEYKHPNLSDTQFYIRYAHDAKQVEEGGPPLQLKEYTTRYIDPEAKLHENLLKKERTDIAKHYNNTFRVALNNAGFSRKEVTQIIKSIKKSTFHITDLPKYIYDIYTTWLDELPLKIRDAVDGIVLSENIPYDILDRETLLDYAHKDIIYTLETLWKLKRTVEARKNQIAVEQENSLILPWLDMERCGFKIDKKYLEESRIKLKKYILQKRNEFKQLMGENVEVGQSAEIKRIFKERFDIELETTKKEKLSKIRRKLIDADENPNAIKAIEILGKLRTLEKWYSAYIIRFIKQLKYTDRIYTQINSVGTISGRVTSDFQQMPKEPILDDDENEIFHPRKIVLVDKDNNFTNNIYLDYSQIELRFQDFYTILVEDIDFNLSRAYMPYKCINEKGELFDYKNKDHIKNWNEKWYLEEDTTKLWKPTDVHAVTTTNATGLTETDEDFKLQRTKVGKKVNFLKNYRGGLSKIKEEFPDKTHEECVKINDSYYKSFPGVKSFHKYCDERAKVYSNTENLFGIRYYNVSGHHLSNLLVQGSAAFYLKMKIREVWLYMQEHNMKSKLQMQIHDELSWERHEDDDLIHFKNMKHIMEDFPDTFVPIVVDIESTETNWAEKQEIA